MIFLALLLGVLIPRCGRLSPRAFMCEHGDSDVYVTVAFESKPFRSKDFSVHAMFEMMNSSPF